MTFDPKTAPRLSELAPASDPRHLKEAVAIVQPDPLEAEWAAEDAARRGQQDGGPPSTGDPAPDLAAALDRAHRYLCRFVAFPSSHAAVAAVLWAAHTHRLEVFDSTPRIAFLSPEPGSGKTRALEVVGLLVPSPMHAVNATPAALFRAVSDLDDRPTILFDEIDTVFGPKAKDNEEVRGFLNAGHRRSGVAYRCVGLGTVQKVVAFPAYCAVAVAGLHDVPDTIASRAVIIRMRRRKPSEQVEPFRARVHEPHGHQVREALAAALAAARLEPDPVLPPGVCDRPADVWEPLLAVAQAAGGRWPELAAAACLHFVNDTAAAARQSLPVLLLADLRKVFSGHDAMHTADVLTGLHGLEEAPWSDLRGRPLDARGLARMLSGYGVRSRQVFIAGANRQGFRAEDLHDPWERYLPLAADKSPRSPRPPSVSVEPAPDLGDTALDLGDTALDLGDTPGPAERELGPLGDLGDLPPQAGSACPGCGQPVSHPDLFNGWHVGCAQ